MARTELEQMVFMMDVNLAKMTKKLDRLTQDTRKTTTDIQKRFDAVGGSISGGLTNAVGNAASQVPILGDALLNLGGPVALTAAAGIGALAFGLTQAKAAMDWADETQATADKIGITAEALQKLQFAAGEADVEVAAMEEGMKALNATLGAVLTGVGATKIEKAFKAIGISKADLEGMNSASDLLPKLADGISGLGTQAERVQIAKKLGVEALLPLLDRGSEGLVTMTDSADSLAQIIDNETTRALSDMSRQVEIADGKIDKQLKISFLNLAPAIVNAKGALADFLEMLNGSGPAYENGRKLTRIFALKNEASKKGIFGRAADEYAAGVLRNEKGMSTASSERVTSEQMAALAGIKPARRGTQDDEDRGGGTSKPSQQQASDARRLIEALATEDEKLALQYRRDATALKAGLKQRAITQAEYDKAFAELTRQYNMKSSGNFDSAKVESVDLTKLEASKPQDKAIDTEAGANLDVMTDKVRRAQEVATALGDAFEYSFRRAANGAEDFSQVFIDEIRAMAAAYAASKLTDFLFGNVSATTGRRSGGWLDGLLDGKRAMGGPVSAGGTYLVGENGPELFRSKVGGNIIPNHDLSRLKATGGASGNMTITLRSNYNIEGAVGRPEIAAAIQASHERAVRQATTQMRKALPGLNARLATYGTV